MTTASAPSVKASSDRIVWWPLLLGLCLMYWPALSSFLQEMSAPDGQGHGVIILAVSAWLIYRKWNEVDDRTASSPAIGLGTALFVLSLVVYSLGRFLSIVQFEVGSAITMLMAIVLLIRGPRQLRSIAFPLFFMLFMIPFPRALADALTHPMKIAVSHVAEEALRFFGLPIARTGVVLQLGQYQLLVADACAGLYTLFTLESMGLLYMNVVHSSSVLRNVVLAVLIVPISFLANVTRVVVLCLITYFFGDAAGQGYLHGFAGMVLFLSALALIMSADSALRMLSRRLDAKNSRQ